jgi:hypothetical protein
MLFYHKYSNLDAPTRKSILHSFINKANNAGKVNVDIDDTGLEKLSTLDLNRRQVSFNYQD